MTNHCRIVSILAIFLASCASEVRLPYIAQINTIDRPAIVWHQLDSHLQTPGLELVSKDQRTHLASVESVFDSDTVASLGPPRGDMLQTFHSPSGDTIIAHECASESSPCEHIAIFVRNTDSDTWSARSVFPPHCPGPVYGHYGVSKGVDDHFLYFHFPDGRLRKIRLDELRERPVRRG